MGSKKFFAGMSKPSDMQNLSKSGLAFEIDQALGFGEKIHMKLQFPDGSSLELKGQIRWNVSMNGGNVYKVGIQFFPFGTSRNYNPLKALDYLRSIDGLNIINLNPK
jgi:hypothetical protein